MAEEGAPVELGPDAPAAASPGPSRLTRGVEAGKKAFSVVELGLRVAFFLAAPQLIPFLGLFFPVWGIVVNVGVALVVFFIAHRVRSVPVLSRVLGRALRFEAYYREHAPKPFLYYVFFPLLFPYWLAVGTARREVTVYRPFSGVPLVVLVATNTYQFFARYRPEIPFKLFAIVTAIKVLFELFAVMLFLMPVATSVVTYERQKRRWPLVALLGAALLSTGLAVRRYVANPPLVASLEVQFRAQWRTMAAGKKAHDTLLAATRLALDDVLEDGNIPAGYVGKWIEGGPLEEAGAKLAELYKPDEVAGFRLTVVRHGDRRQWRALLLFQARSGESLPHVWIAINARGEKIADKAIPARELISAQLGKTPKSMERRPSASSSRRSKEKRPPPPPPDDPTIADEPEPAESPDVAPPTDTSVPTND